MNHYFCVAQNNTLFLFCILTGFLIIDSTVMNTSIDPLRAKKKAIRPNMVIVDSVPTALRLM